MKKRLLKYGIIFVILFIGGCFAYHTQIKQPIEVEKVKITITNFEDLDAEIMPEDYPTYDASFKIIVIGDQGKK